MVTVTTLSRSGPMTRADLDAMPDDGRRHELIDGVLVVSPAPTWSHQYAVGELFAMLRDAVPSGCPVFVAPVDVVLAEDTVMEPDIVVAWRRDLGERDLPGPPLLAVEVLSPSTRRFDLTLERSRLEAAGCAVYWVVDPEAQEHIAWESSDGVYVEVAHLRGDEAHTFERPFAVTVRPSDLALD